MALEIDLKKYCPRVTLDKGLSLYKTCGISHPSCARTSDGAWLLRGKSIDSFNFVSHPWLVVDSVGRRLLGFGCDCPEARQKRTLCEHCISLCFAWMEDVPDYIFAQEQPVGGMPVYAIEPIPEFTMLIREPVYTEPAPQAAPQVPTPAPMEDIPTEDVPAEELPAKEMPEEESQTAAPVCAEPEQEVFRSMEILFGQDENDQDVIWYPNDTERVFHTNVGIIGTMGTGKTQFAKSMLTQLYLQQANNFDGHPLGILIFDYKGDYNETKRDFVDATKARVLKPYRLPFNPLALNPGKSFKPLLPMHTANEFKDTISQIYGLGPKQQQLLLNCIVKAYEKQGIDAANPLTWGRQAPTIEQVYKIFENETFGRPADKLTAAMNKLHQFCLFENDPRKAMSLDQLLSGVVVIDMSGYDSDIQSTIVAITLNQFYARMQAQGSSRTDGQYRQLRKFIMVDEADTFMGEDFPSLRRILKEGREFGVGVILSTQSLTHYVGNADDYSRYVLTWVVHNVGDLKQKDVEYVFKLQPKTPEVARNYSTIKGLQKHMSVVKLGNDTPVTMHNKAFYQLYQQMKADER